MIAMAQIVTRKARKSKALAITVDNCQQSATV